jgi:hypothetical protein
VQKNLPPRLDHRAMRTQAGLPAEWSGAGELAFDAPTKTRVFACSPAVSAGPSLLQLYVRGSDAPTYTSVMEMLERAHKSSTGRKLVLLHWLLGGASHVFLVVGELTGALHGRSRTYSETAAARRLIETAFTRQAVSKAATMLKEFHSTEPPLTTRGVYKGRPIFGINELGLVRFDLRDLSFDVWHPKTTGGATIILSNLVGSDAADEYVYAVAGFPAPVPNGNVGNYHLTRFSWTRRTVRKLQPMPDVWF